MQGTLHGKKAFQADEPVVLLIDEIDKADIRFPNDLLRELNPRMEFHVYETRDHLRRAIALGHHVQQRKDLPDAFLRRCFFRIPSPTATPCATSSPCTTRI